MDNLLLLSMLVATVAVPAFTSRMADGRRALAWTLVLLALCTLAYLVLVAHYYARNFAPEPFVP